MEKLLKYPVIAIGKGQVLHFARSAKDLTTCSSKGLKNGYYNNLKIIDSAGKCFLVIKAEKTDTIGPFWGFSLLMGQRLSVKLYFNNQEENILLDNFKALILNLLNKDKYFWNSDGLLMNRKEFVQNAESHSEIISQLTNEFYKEYKV